MTKSTIDALKEEFFLGDIAKTDAVEVRGSSTPDEKLHLVNMLKRGVWIVEFLKVDGTKATMECTLDPALLPPAPEKVTESKRPEQPHLIHVYSTDRKGWRSFIVGNLTKIYRQPDNL